MSKPRLALGIQCQEKHEEVYRYNRELRPVVVKSINIVDPGHYTRLATENPGAELVYRQVPNGSWDNEGDGRRWAEHLHRLVGHIPEITMVEGHNEWVHSPPHNSLEDFEKADRFMVGLVDGVHELWGDRVHAVVLNASCGHFSEDIVDFFPRTLAKLQECGKCLLGLHEYDHPDKDMLGDGKNYLCGKFLRNLAGLGGAGYDKVRIAITECGVDSGVGAPAGSGHIGFKYWGENAAPRYLNERNLGWYLPLIQETDGVAWATIFGCGMHGDWDSFDVTGTSVIDGIGEIYSGWIPPEPNGGKMDIKVIDMNYEERDFEWAERKYGVAVRRAKVEPGQKVYRLVELWEKTGHTSLITQVLDENGHPLPNVPVTFYWVGAPYPPEPATEIYPHDWHQLFVWGPTGPKGDVGPGMGTGAYHGEGEGGPHAVWIHDPNIPSDICEKLGMLAGTFHDHLDQKFKLEIAGEVPPPNDDDVPLELVGIVKEPHNVSTLAIAYPTSVATDTRGDGRGPGVDEDLYPKEWVHPDGTVMAMVELTTDFEGDEPRTYTLRVYRMVDGASLTDTESETFPPLGAPRERVVYVYVKAGEEPPEPPVPPENGTLGKILATVEATKLDTEEILRILGTSPPVDVPYWAQYYANKELSGSPILERHEDAIMHDWGTGSPPGVPDDDFSAKWTATRWFAAGTWTFHFRGDDGMRLWVDEVLIFDQWHDQSPTSYEVEVVLTEGLHGLEMHYYERGGRAVCQMWYEKG